MMIDFFQMWFCVQFDFVNLIHGRTQSYFRLNYLLRWTFLRCCRKRRCHCVLNFEIRWLNPILKHRWHCLNQRTLTVAYDPRIIDRCFAIKDLDSIEVIFHMATQVNLLIQQLLHLNSSLNSKCTLLNTFLYFHQF